METQLTNRISRFTLSVGQVAQRLTYETQSIVRLKERIKVLEEEKTTLVKAVGVLDKCIQIISANGIGKIESIVTGGLRLAFPDTPDIGLVIEKNEGKRGYSYRILVREGEVVGSAMDSFGGGIQNTVAFLLRVLMIRRFKLAKFLVIDESFANVSDLGGYVVTVSQMLKKLCTDHGYTILAITHNRALASAADAVYQVFPVQGKAPVLRRLEPHEIKELKEPGGTEDTAQASG